MSEERSLKKKVQEGVYEIEVKETLHRGKKLALNKKGERTLSKEENEALKSFMDRYEDLIFKLQEIDEEYNGVDRAWHLGRALVESKNEAEGKFSFTELIPALPIDKFSSSLAYRYRKLYKMFPDQGYEQEHTHTFIHEIAQRAEDTSEAQEVYQRIVDAEITVDEKEVRAWDDVEEVDLQNIVRAVEGRIDTGIVESVKSVYILLGEQPPAESEIQSEL